LIDCTAALVGTLVTVQKFLAISLVYAVADCGDNYSNIKLSKMAAVRHIIVYTFEF